MKKLSLLLLCAAILLTQIQPIRCESKTWLFRRVFTVYEEGGLERRSYPVDITFSSADFTDKYADLRISDDKNALIPYQIVSATNAKFTVRIAVDLPAKGRKNFYVYHGNKDALPKPTTFVTTQSFIGEKFATLAFGEIKICSYTKDNEITVTDANGNLFRDAHYRVVTKERYPAGSIRSIKLKEPMVVNISATGLCSVAVGNFGQFETDCTALTSNDALVYVPRFLAVTSLRDGNKIRIKHGNVLTKEQLLDEGKTLVLDGLSPGMRKIEADYTCLIQYGTASKYALFAVPGNGLKYSFFPLGETVVCASYDDTEINITSSDPLIQSPTKSLKAGQILNIPTKFTYEQKKEVQNAIIITSNKPITVLNMGEIGGNGATMLPCKDGKFIGNVWETITGSVNKSNPSMRTLTALAPYSGTVFTPTGTFAERFSRLPNARFATSPMTVSTEYVNISGSSNQPVLFLDGKPDDKAALFQVPPLKDSFVTYTISDPVPAGVGKTWNPEGPVEPDKIPLEDKSGFAKLWDILVNSVRNPKENPIPFAILLLVFAGLILIVAALLWNKPSKKEKRVIIPKEASNYDELSNKSEIDSKKDDIELDIPFDFGTLVAQEHAQVVKKPELAKPKQFTDYPALKPPKLKTPNLSRLFSDNDINNIKFDDKFGPPKQEKCEIDLPEEPIVTEPEIPLVIQQAQPEQQFTQETSNPDPEFKVTQTEVHTGSSPDRQVVELAQSVSNAGAVADAGAILRLFKEGRFELFSKLFVSHTITSLLPAEVAVSSILEKVMILGKDEARAQKLSSDLGVFDEIGRALVTAEKTKAQYYITTSRLPEYIGKLCVLNVDKFC
jgi:hypothetical protein